MYTPVLCVDLFIPACVARYVGTVSICVCTFLLDVYGLGVLCILQHTRHIAAYQLQETAGLLQMPAGTRLPHKCSEKLVVVCCHAFGYERPLPPDVHSRFVSLAFSPPKRQLRLLHATEQCMPLQFTATDRILKRVSFADNINDYMVSLFFQRSDWSVLH